jgi:single-strand DNA-binding protein
MNKVQILGTITRDIDLQYAPSGTAIAKVGIAVNKRYTSNGEKKEEVSYFNCVAFGKTGENINKYFQKGSRILISGELKEDRWEKDGQKQSRVSILIDGFDFIDKNNSAPNPKQAPKVETYNAQGKKTAEYDMPEIDIDDSQIPF